MQPTTRLPGPGPTSADIEYEAGEPERSDYLRQYWLMIVERKDRKSVV